MPATTVRQVLQEATPTREMVDRFLDPDAYNWATFDPELGYRLQTSNIRDGVDGCYTISHYGASGERRMINYADRPCRINTYGDSFTQCHQVSDGETWQETLAAHFGEPIRNFGVGGYGVYQAYRRMVREEATASACPFIIFNVWSDDHVRSIYAWRWLHVRSFRQHFVAHPPLATEASMFHCNAWAHVRLNVETGLFEERPNPYPTPASLYQLCDADHVYEAFRSDFVVQAFAARHGAVDVDRGMLEQACDALDVPADFGSIEATAATAQALISECGLQASFFIFDRIRGFVETTGKRLVVLLSYSAEGVIDAIHGERRFDQCFIDYLTANGFPFVDTLEKHVADFHSFRCSPEAYVERYFIGHYNPSGNRFFAFSVKDEVVEWLDPKPPAYREGGPSLRRLAAALA
jgi:hypothetical protein